MALGGGVVTGTDVPTGSNTHGDEDVISSVDLHTAFPRIFCVTDPAARVAAVIERRPRKWWRLSRWDLVSGVLDEGAWFRGTLYPQRCDLSPGGRWLSYFAFKHGSAWPAGETYNAISRLPWLRALAAWEEIGTYSRGLHFVADPGVWEVGDPVVGGASVRVVVGGMRPTDAAQFAMERRRGWRESVATPSRDPTDLWDERRDIVMEKPSPGDAQVVLYVAGKFEAFRSSPQYWPPSPAPYSLNCSGARRALPDMQWADWTGDGLLAVASQTGDLQVRDATGRRVIHEARLSDQEPEPKMAPAWAGEW